jgi:lactoylglutathione lyase
MLKSLPSPPTESEPRKPRKEPRVSETVTTSTVTAKLGFMKFVVADMQGMLDFYGRALGLVVAQTIEADHFVEKILRRPGETAGFSLILFHYKDGRAVTVGNGHGPLGLYVRDVDAAYAHAISQGAKAQTEPYDTGAMRVAFVQDPEGRELELISMLRA